MSLEYIIYKLLKIKHITGISYILLYYYIDFSEETPDFDSDDEDFTQKIKLYFDKNIYLKTDTIPIYKNKKYLKEKLKEKYNKLVENKINNNDEFELKNPMKDIGILNNIDEIINIDKIEIKKLRQ
jgi:hypothetical protein